MINIIKNMSEKLWDTTFEYYKIMLILLLLYVSSSTIFLFIDAFSLYTDK